MAFSQRLEIRQGHALVMTPQLMQAIKLLQLSNLDLAAYVDSELESNPLLERGEETEPAAEPAAAAGEPKNDVAPGALADETPAEPEIDDISTADGNAASPRDNVDLAFSSPDWSGIASGRREDGDYN